MILTRAWRSAHGAGLTVTLLEGRAGLRLRGEADLLTVGALHQAAGALPADAREIHLELAELSFSDVAAARQLAALARRPARPRLTLHQPPRSLVLLLRLLWPDCTPPRLAARRTTAPPPASKRPECDHVSPPGEPPART